MKVLKGIHETDLTIRRIIISHTPYKNGSIASRILDLDNSKSTKNQSLNYIADVPIKLSLDSKDCYFQDTLSKMVCPPKRMKLTYLIRRYTISILRIL